ncbi:iron ABC transporter permease [Roseiarcaceae bacterium H3SJ34-1]|uniref:FecCD family ABC transporter permease n=1 Tax=Terripilifer ovatus TaxID=3032367 RepID=UPI003AB9A097|nr:iron ABC transporter permease [Roseiarcaceae bacterium H3SJ34-1]
MSAEAATAAQVRSFVAGRKRRTHLGFLILALVVILSVVVALTSGPIAIPPQRLWALARSTFDGQSSGQSSPGLARDALVLFNIRLPRIVLALLLGAALGVSGALMQGLFRNPLADPGIAGISSGAALAAALMIVLGHHITGVDAALMQTVVMPLAAFLGGLIATMFLYGIATREGQTSVATMLLAGIALAALAMACIGLLIFISDDRQLRDITFWTLGSLGGANWQKVSVVAPMVTLLLGAMPFLARGMNALSMGGAAAFHLGVPVQIIKTVCIVLVALAVGVSVAAAGTIGFVGIVVPHLLRLAIGADYRALLPMSAMAGAALLVIADAIARTIVAPADLPIGILTALIGGPFFLWLLLRRNRNIDL